MTYVIGQLIITLREALEALLLVSIMVAYLKKTEREQYVKSTIYGAVIAFFTGGLIAVGVINIYGALEESSEALFEGLASLLAVGVLTYMIYWMAIKGRDLRLDVERKIAASGGSLAIASASYIFVVREVIETILFLIPFATRDLLGTIIGVVLGISIAFIFSYGIVVGVIRFSLRRFFFYSSILLVLIAGGLVGYGIHEILEYVAELGRDLGWLATSAYHLNIPETSLFHHEGLIGSIFAVFFGYSVEMEWLRLLAHLGYLGITLPLIMNLYSTNSQNS